MNQLQDKLNMYRDHIHQLEEWIELNWSKLPDGVKHIICRGEIEYKEKIKQYELWAKEDNKAD